MILRIGFLILAILMATSMGVSLTPSCFVVGVLVVALAIWLQINRPKADSRDALDKTRRW